MIKGINSIKFQNKNISRVEYQNNVIFVQNEWANLNLYEKVGYSDYFFKDFSKLGKDKINKSTSVLLDFRFFDNEHLNKKIYTFSLACSVWRIEHKNIINFILPKQVTYIACLFKNSSFQDIQFGENLKHIGSGSFVRCRFEKDVKIPKSVTDISVNAFNDCIFGGEILIPRNCRFDESAFSGTGVRVRRGNY